MRHPEFELRIGDKVFSTGDGVGFITSSCGMGLPVDGITAVISRESSYRFKPMEEAELKLGYDGSLEKIMAGNVARADVMLNSVLISIDGIGSKLLRKRSNTVFLSNTSGGIVVALAQEAGVEVKELENGINYPYYAIDDRSNLLEHIVRLGRLCGADAFFDKDGKLIFRRPGGGKEHRFAYGKDLLEIWAIRKGPAYDGVAVFGESPVSSKGAETYHWTAKEELKTTKGGERALIITEPSLKSSESAEKAGEALLEASKYTVILNVRSEGKPGIRVGDTITLEGFDDREIDGSHEVTRVEHTLSASSGFTSTFTCRRKLE
ncbi:MAG: phage late control D family protein [Candidatus Methanosuratincola sp.]|jgi:phage protein D